jgi:phosphatidate cytidylyltransferase
MSDIETAPQASTAKPPDSSLKTRVRSALLMAPPVLLVIFFGGWGFAIMLAAAAGVAVHEWGRMLSKAYPFAKGLVLLSACLAAMALLVSHLLESAVGTLLFALSLFFLIFAYNYANQGPRLRLLLAGILYIICALGVMVWIRLGLPEGLFHFMTLLLVVWSSDSFAYLFGRMIGGPKLAPKISPKKTWAGFIGSSLGAGAVAALLAVPAVTFADAPRTLGGLGPQAYFLLGAVLGAVGQAGDLLVSYFKRRFEIKDTGALIPGHGGLLDRIDALLLVALAFGGFVVCVGAAAP